MPQSITRKLTQLPPLRYSLIWFDFFIVFILKKHMMIRAEKPLSFLILIQLKR